MNSDTQIPKHRFQFSLRTLLLLFIPVALIAALVNWFLQPAPIDVAITVDRFSWYDDGAGHRALGAEVRIKNRSKSTVWYLENPRYCLQQRVDGKWTASLEGTSLRPESGKEEPDWWSSQDGMQAVSIMVGPISEKATVMKVGVPFTTDRFAPKEHWVFCPVVKIVKKGKDYIPEVKEETTSADAQVNEAPSPPANGVPVR